MSGEKKKWISLAAIAGGLGILATLIGLLGDATDLWAKFFPPPPPPPQPVACKISGKVFDPNGGKPLAAAVIDVYSRGPGGRLGQKISGAVATTDDLGIYGFSCTRIKSQDYPILLVARSGKNTAIADANIVEPAEYEHVNIPLTLLAVASPPIKQISPITITPAIKRAIQNQQLTR